MPSTLPYSDCASCPYSTDFTVNDLLVDPNSHTDHHRFHKNHHRFHQMAKHSPWLLPANLPVHTDKSQTPFIFPSPSKTTQSWWNCSCLGWRSDDQTTRHTSLTLTSCSSGALNMIRILPHSRCPSRGIRFMVTLMVGKWAVGVNSHQECLTYRSCMDGGSCGSGV